VETVCLENVADELVRARDAAVAALDLAHSVDEQMLRISLLMEALAVAAAVHRIEQLLKRVGEADLSQLAAAVDRLALVSSMIRADGR
jgi:hypothetical protein